MAAAAVFLSLLSVPRRPVVFRRETAVLNESGVSILDWNFFFVGSAARPSITVYKLESKEPAENAFQPVFIYLEKAVRRLQSDQSAMDTACHDFTEALGLAGVIGAVGGSIRIWQSLVIHSLLQRLEKGPDIDASTWIWVALLPASLLCVSACDNWSSWIGHTRIQLPMLGLLQSLAFEKSMRLRWASDDTSTEGKHTTNAPSVMDVIESHCNTIAQAFLNAHNLPIAALKIVLYSFYLSRLMRFTTVIIGGTLPILAIWLSRKLSKYQRRAQLEHIEATERTSGLVSEALRGLRQIRLSSMECLWQDRSFAARNHNLAAAWRVSVYEEMVNLVATLGPVLFASVTISIYALRTGHFSPSVAFTSINLFSNLHAVIKQLPARSASLHRAKISYLKLQLCLQQPEQTCNSILGDTVSLRNANLSWVEGEKGAILKNVDLEIPKHGISLITGQVGSGKSLLLYSILEEACVQSGKLTKPAMDTSSGHSTARGIVAGSAAFVSQPPWIEDCTIKENICFGFSSSPYTIFFSAFMLDFYAVIARKALDASQRLRPVVNSCNFPVPNHISSAQSGLTTIRAFGKCVYYMDAMREDIDRSNSAFTHLALGHSWLGIRLGVMGSIFVATVTAATILSKGTASSAGLAITLALQLRQSLNITIGQINVTRSGLNAIDRVLGLASIPSEEEDGEQDEAVAPENWPSHGRVKVRKLGVRFGDNLPWTLNNISFSVQTGQRLGIVGRTGAGKSSLINSLLRFVDATTGEILIDDQDISQVSRKRVRDAVTVTSQDAFLFSGTLRSNVDVFSQHDDDQVISALRSVHFTSFEREGDVVAADLDRIIHSGGSNVSHGQRQLVCLARVILEDRSRIIILDEATSGIDHVTETAIQEVTRENFRGMTVLMVAHQLLTVADSNEILVLSQGEVVEHGAPQQLLASKGNFWNMVEQSEDSARIKDVIRQHGKYV
ncbi:hypothetical protein ARSEF4850_008581 [Beauveria asiatica]